MPPPALTSSTAATNTSRRSAPTRLDSPMLGSYTTAAAKRKSASPPRVAAPPSPLSVVTSERNFLLRVVSALRECLNAATFDNVVGHVPGFESAAPMIFANVGVFGGALASAASARLATRQRRSTFGQPQEAAVTPRFATTERSGRPAAAAAPAVMTSKTPASHTALADRFERAMLSPAASPRGSAFSPREAQPEEQRSPFQFTMRSAEKLSPRATKSIRTNDVTSPAFSPERSRVQSLLSAARELELESDQMYKKAFESRGPSSRYTNAGGPSSPPSSRVLQPHQLNKTTAGMNGPSQTYGASPPKRGVSWASDKTHLLGGQTRPWQAPRGAEDMSPRERATEIARRNVAAAATNAAAATIRDLSSRRWSAQASATSHATSIPGYAAARSPASARANATGAAAAPRTVTPRQRAGSAGSMRPPSVYDSAPDPWQTGRPSVVDAEEFGVVKGPWESFRRHSSNSSAKAAH